MPDLDKIIDDAVANPVLSDAADEIGKDLLNALIGELTLIPHPTVANQNVWSTRKENEQKQTIVRFNDRVRSIVTRAFGHILAAGNPAAQAKLKDVKFGGEKITASLEIDIGCKERHALADFASRHVAVIMPDDLDEYFATMDEVTAVRDQAELDLNTGESAEQKPAAAADDANGAPTDEKTAAAAPDESDRDLAHALSVVGCNVPAKDIIPWDESLLQEAWKYVEEVDKEGFEKTEVPAFLIPYFGPTASNDASDESPTPEDLLNEAASPTTESVAKSTEARDTQPEPTDDREKDKRTLKALVEECLHLAAEIGETDITKNQFKKKGRDGCFDYIAYATKKKQEVAAAAPTESKAAISELVQTLDNLTIYVDVAVVASWTETQRDEVAAYARGLASGKLPDNVPQILTPYMGGEEDAATV